MRLASKGAGQEARRLRRAYAGKIIPFDLKKHGGTLICQKDAFLCAAKGRRARHRLPNAQASGFFGGEGFIMEKARRRQHGLRPFQRHGDQAQSRRRQVLRDRHRLRGLRPASFDISMSVASTALFGGEGLFFATLRGGTVWIQSLPCPPGLAHLRRRAGAERQQRQGGGRRHPPGRFFLARTERRGSSWERPPGREAPTFL